jgi:hypothetical protein
MAQPSLRNSKPFPRILGISDFGITANVTLIQSKYVRIGEYTVPAQTEATFGVNVLRAGGVEGEPLYLKMNDNVIADSAIDGVWKLQLANATESAFELVLEQRSERLYASVNDRTQAFLLTEWGRNARQDSKLTLDFKADSGSKVFDYDHTLSKFYVPVTIYQQVA